VDADGLRREVTAILGEGASTWAPDHHFDDLHDETLHPRTATPLAVLYPTTTAQVSAIAALASREGLALTARGSGTGLSGAASPSEGGVVVCFARMNQVLSIDVDDQVAVVQPGVTLRELNERLAGTGLHYPVHPGELSGSLGGNVNTNAGGMRAVRHGVTRHHVLALELVLADGTVVRTGAPVMKSSSGYDLTQLVIGSEGTLALVTEVTVRLSPVFAHAATALVPFATLDEVTRVVPAVVAAGLQPAMLEYLDLLTMSSITSAAGLELGVAAGVAAATTAYLVVVLETRTADQLESDLGALSDLLTGAGALDVYVLAPGVAGRLIEARERAFWVAKAAGANEIIDVVVPRSRVPDYLARTAQLAEHHGAFVAGCGHVGDGNVHLSVYQPDDARRDALLLDLYREGLALGGQISGEHGLGRDKRAAYLALTDPALIALQARVKAAFDPAGVLNPGLTLEGTTP
jgi:glycolate oxidase